MSKGINGRLRKLLAVAEDARGNPHVRQRAREVFDRTCAQHGIDPASIKVEDHGFGEEYNADWIRLPDAKITTEVRVLCNLVCDVWGGQTVGMPSPGGGIRIVFLTRKPQTPDKARSAFEFFQDRFHTAWESFRKSNIRKLNRRSFYMGMGYTVCQRLLQKKATNQVYERLLAATRAHAVAQKTPAKRNPKPKKNPLALAIIPKAKAPPVPPDPATDTGRDEQSKIPDPEPDPEPEPIEMFEFQHGCLAGATMEAPEI